MSFAAMLNKTAKVIRTVPASGAWGSTDTLQPVADIPCRIQASSGREYADGRIRTEATHLVFMGMFELHTDDLLEIDGKRFEVVPPLIDAGGAGIHLQVWVKERDA